MKKERKRDHSGQRHPLWWILLIVILGLMVGCLSYRDLSAQSI